MDVDFSILEKIIIEVPLIQIGILAGLCTLFALWRKPKLVLVCVYGFILYWVFILNETKFAFAKEAELLHIGLFIITGVIFVGCSAWIIFIDK